MLEGDRFNKKIKQGKEKPYLLGDTIVYTVFREGLPFDLKIEGSTDSDLDLPASFKSVTF